jgi:hypothetical protein
MEPDGVVVKAPALDNDLGLAQCVKDLAIERLVAQGAAQDKKIGQNFDHIDGLELAIDTELAAIVGAVLDEAVQPDMVQVFRPQPDAGTVRELQAAALGPRSPSSFTACGGMMKANLILGSSHLIGVSAWRDGVTT